MKALIVLSDTEIPLREQVRRDLYKYWKSKHDHLSTHAFAKLMNERTTFSYKTFERVLASESVNTNKNFLVQVYSVIMGVEGVAELYVKAEAWLKEILEKEFSHDALFGTTRSNPKVNEYLLTREFSLAIYVFCNGYGQTDASVHERFGYFGSDEAIKMTEKGILRIDNNRYVWNVANQLVMNLEATSAISCTILKHFTNFSNETKPNENYSNFTIMNISPKGHEKIMKVMRDAHLKIAEIEKEDDLIYSKKEQTEQVYAVMSSDKFLGLKR